MPIYLYGSAEFNINLIINNINLIIKSLHQEEDRLKTRCLPGFFSTSH